MQGRDADRMEGVCCLGRGVAWDAGGGDAATGRIEEMVEESGSHYGLHSGDRQLRPQQGQLLPPEIPPRPLRRLHLALHQRHPPPSLCLPSGFPQGLGKDGVEWGEGEKLS